jgi:hypothetical protein
MKKTIYYLLLLLYIFLFIYYIFFYNSKQKIGFDNNKSLGFIITRHVNSENTNDIWKNCINLIRKFYNDVQIIIIDDGSNYNFINTEGVDLTNCTVIKSEYEKRGELLPYYYFYKYKWFDRAIYIHDSVLVHEHINLDNVNSVKFLWDFPAEISACDGGNEIIEECLSHLNYSDELILLFKNKQKWKGCWGAMSVIDYDFLKIIVEKYNMNELLNYITDRSRRMCFERILSILCTHHKPSLLTEDSMFGDYNNNPNDKIQKKFYGR